LVSFKSELKYQLGCVGLVTAFFVIGFIVEGFVESWEVPTLMKGLGFAVIMLGVMYFFDRLVNGP
jgi:hypothetical protein